jgi:hypothetical protein
MASPAVAQELELVRKRHGGILRPADVVAFARDPQTALHAEFEWDDSKAAEQYRLEQARQIIRCAVHVVDEDSPPVRAYVSLQNDRTAGNSYRSLHDVLNEPRLREQLLAQALREAESWRLRYERLAELKPICRAIIQAARQAASQTGNSAQARLVSAGHSAAR